MDSNGPDCAAPAAPFKVRRVPRWAWALLVLLWTAVVIALPVLILGLQDKLHGLKRSVDQLSDEKRDLGVAIRKIKDELDATRKRRDELTEALAKATSERNEARAAIRLKPMGPVALSRANELLLGNPQISIKWSLPIENRSSKEALVHAKLFCIDADDLRDTGVGSNDKIAAGINGTVGGWILLPSTCNALPYLVVVNQKDGEEEAPVGVGIYHPTSTSRPPFPSIFE